MTHGEWSLLSFVASYEAPLSSTTKLPRNVKHRPLSCNAFMLTLVMHEFADRLDERALPIGLGLLEKGSLPARPALWMGACFPAWTALLSCICVWAGGGELCFPAWAGTSILRLWLSCRRSLGGGRKRSRGGPEEQVERSKREREGCQVGLSNA